MSLSSTCSKREDPPSWVKRTNVIKTGVFIGGPPGYAEKSPSRLDILMPANGYHGSDYPSVNLRPVGLGIFEGDGSNWVGGAILKEAEIFDAVRPFQQIVVFSDEAFMAMLESFLPQTNTFIVTNNEIGFSLKKLNAITELPILGKLYEEFMPIDSVPEEQYEEFRLFNVRVGMMVYCRHLFVDIQQYVPSRFALQWGFSQGVVGAPSSKVKRFGGLQDGRNAWAFYSVEDTTAMISYPELPTFWTASFMKWFVESFSAHWGLSMKELDLKQSSGKGLGKSDGVCREEVLAFLSGEKHRTGFLEDQDVIRSGAAQEIPGEVLEQLTEEEAKVAAWMQAERAKASMEFTGKSKPSVEDSIERPDFDGGAEIPSTIAEEASGDDDEPPEKRSRGEKINSDGCVATEEVPQSFSEPKQGVPAADSGVGASSTSFDKAEESPQADIPSSAAPIGNSFLITLSTVPDMDSRPTEHGESSSEPSRQFARKVLKRVLSSWVETLSSNHLEAGFSMVKHVQDILVDSEEVGLDITNAKAFVDEVIALGNK
ncbi:hypothetical protein AAC387_Pa08g1182 [Persea americana]